MNEKTKQGYLDAVALHKEHGLKAVEERRKSYLTGSEGSKQNWFKGFNQAYFDLKNGVFIWTK